MRVLTVLYALATVGQVQQAGNEAFLALRAFEMNELAAFHSQQIWPTGLQHQQIMATAATLQETVHDSLILRFDMTPEMPMSPQAQSLLLHQHEAVKKLDSQVDSTAPDATRALMKVVRQAFDKLLALFPESGVKA
jgi:hypothetical protein